MALSSKRDDLKYVPWFSLYEWYDVYEQIYSNDPLKQERGYKTLLVWKTRVKKLPVGVECTLSLLKVTIRDREWSEKLDKNELPLDYENDLCMMYSLSIMRFLNHICNIGHTKQASLFQIAKQLNIPDWIVNLRHDAAHGYELPSLNLLRLAVNILLTWLNDEYWTAEMKNMIDNYKEEVEYLESSKSEVIQVIEDLIELWTATGLYIHANYHLVSNLPDGKLKKTLFDLRTYTLKESQESLEDPENEPEEFPIERLKNNEEYKLSTAQSVLLTEISKCLARRILQNHLETFYSIICDNEVFLPSVDFILIFNDESSEEKNFDNFSSKFLEFWQPFIVLLQEKKLLEGLFSHLLKLIQDENRDKDKISMASQWLCSLIRALIKHKIAQQVSLNLSQALDCKNDRINSKRFTLRVQDKVDNLYPQLKSFWLNWTIDNTFSSSQLYLIKSLLLHPNEFLLRSIPTLLELVIPTQYIQVQNHLNSLLRINMGDIEGDPMTKEESKLHLLEDFDFMKLSNQSDSGLEEFNQDEKMNLRDEIIRNIDWQLASVDDNWSTCPFGLLPWQMDREESFKPLILSPAKVHGELSILRVIPGIIDPKNLKMKSEINWKDVLRGKRARNRKRERPSDILIGRAIKIIKEHM